MPQVQAASAQGPERHDGVPRVRAGADGIARARLRRGGRGVSAEDLRLAAWSADAWVVYMPPTFADSEMGIHGRYVTIQLPPVQGGARP